MAEAARQPPRSDVPAVRKRPGMYIGNTDDGSGLHRMVYEVVANAIEEARAGRAKEILVVLNPDGSCTVRDNGRGIPTDIDRGLGVSAAEVIMTRLHAGGRFLHFDPDQMWRSVHGVGMIVVNALSTWLKLRIWRDGQEYYMEFADGEAKGPLAVVGGAGNKRGTEVTFLPSCEIFRAPEFNWWALEHRLRELALLTSSSRIVLLDQRHAVERRVEIRSR